MRYFTVLYLDSFYTSTSGDALGKGEFYFKCNGNRYPNKGVIKLGKGQKFDPEPNPVFYTSLTDGDSDLKLDIEVWEEDPGRDDKFIDQVLKYKVNAMNQTIELKDKKGKCVLKLILKIEEAKEW